jgi:hypothetical protein
VKRGKIGRKWGFLRPMKPSAEVARRFGYTPNSFRVLCHRFR